MAEKNKEEINYNIITNNPLSESEKERNNSRRKSLNRNSRTFTEPDDGSGRNSIREKFDDFHKRNIYLYADSSNIIEEER